MPAAAAISSIVVSSNPLVVKSSSPIRSSSSCEVAGGRPIRAAGAASFVIRSSFLHPVSLVLRLVPSDARRSRGALPISAKELFMPVETLENTATDEAVEVDLVEEDLLVEDVSIDGMCGVY